MTRWFRYYDDALNDPKVQSLPGDLFKTWVNLLSVASKYDGQLPSIYELTYLLRRRSDRVEADLNKLVEHGLIDLVDDHFEPHNWRKRQYKSDNSTERWHRWKDAKTNVGEAVGPTSPDNRVQKQIQKESISRASRSELDDREFEELRSVYPKRSPASPPKPARLKYQAARKRGVSHEMIMAGARAYAADCDKLERTGTQYVQRLDIWLNQEGWAAYEHVPTGPPLPDDPIARRDEIRKRMEVKRGDATATSGARKQDNGLLERSNRVDQGEQPKGERSAVVHSEPGNAGGMGEVVSLFPESTRMRACRNEDADAGKDKFFPGSGPVA